MRAGGSHSLHLRLCGLVVPGWTQSAIYDTTTGSFSGEFKPGVPTITTYFNSVPDGNIVVRALNATISQTVTAVADPGATYTLNVDLGFSKKVADDGRIYLDVNGKEVEGTPTAPVVQESGNWVDYTASYTATAADSGGPIGIILWSLGRGPQGFFDNVRLAEVTPQSPSVPEPATWAMMLIGFSGLCGPRSLATARCGAASERQCLPLELVRPTSYRETRDAVGAAHPIDQQPRDRSRSALGRQDRDVVVDQLNLWR